VKEECLVGLEFWHGNVFLPPCLYAELLVGGVGGDGHMSYISVDRGASDLHFTPLQVYCQDLGEMCARLSV
jgi:hypothetical protein